MVQRHVRKAWWGYSIMIENLQNSQSIASYLDAPVLARTMSKAVGKFTGSQNISIYCYYFIDRDEKQATVGQAELPYVLLGINCE